MRAGLTPARRTLVGKGLEYLDRLAAEARSDPSIQRDLIGGYTKMGNVQGNLYVANLGESSGAEQSYRKALAIAEALVRSRPNDPEARSAVAATEVKLGTCWGRTKAKGGARQICPGSAALRALTPGTAVQPYFGVLSGDTAGAEEAIQDALRTYQSSPTPEGLGPGRRG